MTAPNQMPERRAFTMIELLVVIAIIAILAGLLLPAVIGGLKKADVTQAQTEVRLIAAAMNAYRADYGKWPGEYPGRVTTKQIYWDYKALIAVLRGSNIAGTVQDQLGLGSAWKNQNPKQRVYLQVSEKNIATNGNGTDGSYSGSLVAPNPPQPYVADTGMLADPWGNRYVVLPDWNMDGIIEGPDGESSIRASVAVWSWGPNPVPGPGGTLESPTNTLHIRSWR
jgi:prepilin-type N-terminal cleavage/methylation domain-containing protein